MIIDSLTRSPIILVVPGRKFIHRLSHEILNDDLMEFVGSDEI
jgi:hypothetical protein